VIAALVGRLVGETIPTRVLPHDRGYERIEEKKKLRA